MKRNIVKIALLGLVAAALTIVPTISRAQDATNTPAATPHKKHNGIIPFQGKISAIDATAQTVTVGKWTLNVTSTTKISNVSTKATVGFSELTVGEAVTGSYKKGTDGTTLNAYSIHVGGQDKHKKKKPTTSEDTSTNAPAVTAPASN